MMTDNEIIKALSFCGGVNYMDDCPEESEDCYCNIAKYAFDLINRQKAEIERLTHYIEAMAQTMPNMAKAERAESIKEFAERLKHMLGIINGFDYDCSTIFYHIDNLVKEMVGDV